jgi:alcohol dehydrogenase
MTDNPYSPFDFQPRTRVIFGPGSLERVGQCARELGGKKILLVTDKGIVAAGHADHCRRILAQEHLALTVFDAVRENPTTRDVDACRQMAGRAGIDLIVGLGGGSSMDTAKGCNFLLSNGGQMRDYWGVGKAAKPMLPLIAVPTTAGTGSECQSFALIAIEETHQKMACGDPKAAARVAILDPLLTLSQPTPVTAHTGIDAVAHAVETAVTKKQNPLSLLFSREAFKLCATNFERVLKNPKDLEARGKMLLGAAFGGTAIENSMLGAAHSAANPLTAHFGVVHGEAVGIMLPHVVEFNAHDEKAAHGYADLAAAAKIVAGNGHVKEAVSELKKTLGRLLNSAKVPRSLADYGVKPDAIPILADEAATQWTAAFNPRALTTKDFAKLYTAALEARE